MTAKPFMWAVLFKAAPGVHSTHAADEVSEETLAQRYPGHRVIPLYATPPIAGAGENETDIEWITTANVLCDRLGIERKADSYHIVSGISQFHSRIGELERKRDEALADRDHYKEMWEQNASATHAAVTSRIVLEEQLAGEELNELAKHTSWELSWGELDPNWEGGECCWLVHERSGNRNDREWSLIGYGATPAEALRQALEAKPCR